jgi:hypothetical protein
MRRSGSEPMKVFEPDESGSRSPYRERWNSVPVITSVDQYTGQPSVRIAATQLAPEFSRSAATRIVGEWVEFFSSGTSPIRELEFVSRTPNRLFEALAAQSQLQRLEVKWGDYDDLAPLSRLDALRELRLGGASSLRSLDGLRDLRAVRTLMIDSLRHVRDLGPIARMPALLDLEVGGDWASPRIVHVDSISFLDDLPQLRNLVLHTLIVDDLDYTPLLRLPHLESVRVMKARGMQPEIERLMRVLPWKN